MTNHQHQDHGEDNGILLKEIAGWPATVGVKRMNEALDHITNNPGQAPQDPQLAEDTKMLVFTIAMHHLPTSLYDEMDPSPSNPRATMDSLITIVRNMESHHTFGGIILGQYPSDPDLLELKHIFALTRHPQWMGASTYLQCLKDLDITVFESHTRPGQPGILIAAPAQNGGYPFNARDFPEGEPALLRTITLWHEAASCHWIPNRHGDGDLQPPKAPPSLTIAR